MSPSRAHTAQSIPFYMPETMYHECLPTTRTYAPISRALGLLLPRLVNLRLQILPPARPLAPPLPLPLQPLQPLLFLRRDPRLDLLMVFAQRLPPDHQTKGKRQASGNGVEDPHGAQTLRVRVQHRLLLGRRQGIDDRRRRAGRASHDELPRLRREPRELGRVLAHLVLKYDATYNDGHGGREVAGEAKGRGRGGDVAGPDFRLESDEWGLEVGADADPRDDLEDDDARPGRVGGEVDVEAEAEGHEESAEPDHRAVTAGLADDNAGEGGHEGQAKHVGEEVYA